MCLIDRLRRALPVVAALLLVIEAVVALAAGASVLCFGRDGHVAVESANDPHVSLLNRGTPPTSGDSLNDSRSHGPCVDVALINGVSPEYRDISTVTMAQVSTMPSPAPGRLLLAAGAVSSRAVADLSTLRWSFDSLRTTVLRI